MLKKTLVTVVGGFILASCASKVHRGVVAMKIDESVAHVGLKNSEVSEGDHVELFTNQCRNVKDVQNCQKVSKGHGVVTKVISDDYVTVKFNDGVSFKEGDTVEKHSH